MNAPEPAMVGGRYVLGELLGRGGMAEVRKGTDTRLGRTVAIKRLRTDLASDATFQARFRREAQSSASLNHPAIVAVYDTGEEPATDGSGVSQPYIVMEYVAGRTLRDILREGRKILPERALEITSDILSALDYSHRAGIIHRDIKPANVMLTPAGDVKVMDFGIARAMSDVSQTMTQTAAVVGTAQYLSPEQARGDSVDARSDVYAAGCVLYELLTGRPPFVGDSPVSVAYQHVREHPLPPSAHDPSLPPEIDQIVMKALVKRVDDRYQSAAAMRDDIERYLAGRPIAAEPVPPAPPSDAPTAIVGAPVPERERSRTGLLIGIIVLVLAIVAAAVFLIPRLFNSGPDQVAVPNVLHLPVNTARSRIGKAGLIARIDPKNGYASSMTVPAGDVIKQSPGGGVGSYADAGSTVILVVSTGKPQVKVPNVLGQTFANAKSLLAASPYYLHVTRVPVPSQKPKGTVTAVDPPAGTPVQSGSTVALEVSKGPNAVPNVVGMTMEQAEQVLAAAGFQAVPTADTTPGQTAAPDTVTQQSPPANSAEKKNTPVVIWVVGYTGSACPSTNPDGTPADTSTCAPSTGTGTDDGLGNGGFPPGQQGNG